MKTHKWLSNSRKVLENLAEVIQSDTPSLWRQDPKCHSSRKRLIWISGWLIWFIFNLKRSIDRKIVGEILPSEVKDTGDWFIRSAQEQNSFAEEYRSLKEGYGISSSSKLICLQLQPWIIIKLWDATVSRIEDLEFLSIETRYPVILPQISWVTKLIIKQYHKDGNHNIQTNHTLAVLLTTNWIISARKVIREVEKDYVVCRRHKAKLATQVMVPLPDVQ